MKSILTSQSLRFFVCYLIIYWLKRKIYFYIYYRGCLIAFDMTRCLLFETEYCNISCQILLLLRTQCAGYFCSLSDLMRLNKLVAKEKVDFAIK